MTIDFVSVSEFGLDAAADVLARGFSDYLVKLPATTAMLLQMARLDSVDLAASRVVRRDGVALGAALIARRGWTSRLAGMSLVPEARRQQVGRALMTQVLEEAKARGDRAMVLEVIEQNEPAVKLYEACGFQRVRRLVGYSLAVPATASAAGASAELEDVDVRTAAAAVTAHGLPDLPWQLSGETLAQLGPPTRAFRARGAWIICTDPMAAQVTVRALVDENGEHGGPRTAELLRTMMARHGGREWRVGAIWPEELGGVFADAGFTRATLSQWQMVRATA